MSLIVYAESFVACIYSPWHASIVLGMHPCMCTAPQMSFDMRSNFTQRVKVVSRDACDNEREAGGLRKGFRCLLPCIRFWCSFCSCRVWCFKAWSRGRPVVSVASFVCSVTTCPYAANKECILYVRSAGCGGWEVCKETITETCENPMNIRCDQDVLLKDLNWLSSSYTRRVHSIRHLLLAAPYKAEAGLFAQSSQTDSRRWLN